MCGIAGILSCSPDLDLRCPLESMLGALRHRGPDDEGLEITTIRGGYRLGLAHTRLSVLDPSPAGHQPMADPDSGSWITYNGEIYNHQLIRRELDGWRPEAGWQPAPRQKSLQSAFRGGSDTETVLKAWVRRGP